MRRRARENSGLGMRDKRAAIHMLCIRELLQRNGTDMRWVNGSAVLAGGIAKSHAP